MKIKLTLISLVWIFFISSIFAIGVLDTNGNFVYYVNNTNPQINVNITSPSQIINISHAKIELITNEVKVNESIESKNYLLNPGENKIFTFNLEQNLTTSDSIHFKLFAYGSQNNEVTPEGDPTNFYIRYDGIAPILLSPNPSSEIYLTSEDLNINLNFNEKLASYSIFLEDTLINIKDSEPFLSSYPNTISVNINKDDLTEGANNNLTIKVIDLAGNTNEYILKVFYRGEEIKINLLTKENDPSLKYYYNKNYPNFFNKTIYSSENVYTLKVETSKPAICYYSNSLSSFKEFNEISSISSLSMFNSDLDKKNHTISVDASPYSQNSFKQIWVACVNIDMNNDVAYLSNSLGISNSLITLKTYQNSTIDIIDYSPKNEVTSTFFSASAKTNNLAICSFKLDSNTFSQMTSVNYVNHLSSSISTTNGNHTLNFKCFDVLNNIALKSYNLNIDNTKGVNIVSYSPKFSGNSQVIVNLVLSEDVVCKYSNKVESPADFMTLKNLSGFGFNRNFSATLSNRNNIFYIYCDKGTIVENILSIIYDSSSPVLSNFVFLNNNVKSNYSGDDKKLEFKFDVNSSIPVTNYYVKVIFADSSKNILRTFSSNDISISGDFRNASKISVIAQNEVGKNSTALEKTIQFDFEEPVVSFVNSNGVVSIRCIDSQSGCDKIYYGISSTPIDCNAKLRYSSNGNFTVQKNNYVCAEAFDRVGHRGFKQELILVSAYGSGSSNSLNNSQSSNNKPLDGRNMTELESDEEEFIDDSSNDENDNSNAEDEEDAWVSNNYDEQPQDAGVNYILIAAIVLILVSVSGGGYYAYKKGYLNKELERMGIKKPTNAKVNSTLTNTPQTQLQASSKNNASNNTLSRTKYDDHLNKLNSFVENTIQKRKDMFDKFGVKTNTPKQKETTGVQGVKNRKISNKGLTAEDMDDFYEGAKGSVGSKTQDPNYKHEAENFEEYYQKKKKSTSENNKK